MITVQLEGEGVEYDEKRMLLMSFLLWWWLLLLTNHLLSDRAAKESLQASVGVCHWLCEGRHDIDMCVRGGL